MAVAFGSGFRRSLLALPLILLTTLACEKQADIVEPVEAELRIVGLNKEIQASWALKFPDGTQIKSVGDTTLTGLVPGDYQLVWEPVEAYDSPEENPVDRTLKSGGVETMEGRYSPIPGSLGDLMLDPRPRNLQAPWFVVGPRGFYMEGTGRGVMKRRAAGIYNVTWGDVPGYRTPDPRTVEVGGDQTVEIGADYVTDDGVERPVLVTVVVDPNPDELAAPWEIVAEDGTTYSGRGDRILADIPISVFTLTWGPVDGYEPPQPNPVTIDPQGGQAVLVVGN